MKSLFHKISVFLRMIRIYKNFLAVTLYRLNLRPAPLVIKIRDGAKFKVRNRRVELSDAYVINECYLYGIHDRLLPYLQSAEVGLDIGAHIGAFSIFAAKKSNAIIHAFEPAPINFCALTENIRLNNFEKRIIPVEKAVAKSSGTTNIYIPADGGFVTTLRSHLELFGISPASVKEVPTVSLTDYFRDQGIEFCDFIKMDCEGGEYDIIYNLPATTLQKIGVLSIEYHRDGNVEELSEFFRRHNFEVVRPSLEFAEIFCLNKSLR